MSAATLKLPGIPPAAGLGIAACAGRSDQGATRTRNEDRLLAAPPLLAVADGVGGHAGGAEAAEVTLAELRRAAPELHDPEPALRHAFEAANAAVRRAARGDRRASTLVCALVRPAAVTVAHVGDSRAYLLRDGRLAALTRDHSLVASLVASGPLDPRAARSHPLRSRIHSAVGLQETIEPTVATVPTRPGDVLLLCSDGLSDALEPERLEHLLADEPDLQRLPERLADAARRAGGGDDITLIAARLD